MSARLRGGRCSSGGAAPGFWRAGDVAIAALLAGAVAEAAVVPPRSALALGGFGGIALGVASRQAAENLLGGVVLAATAPFVPGDAIRARGGGGGSSAPAVEGKVTSVGLLRSVVVGWDGVQTSVLSSLFTAALITNVSRVTSRRFRQLLRLRPEDIGRVPAVVGALRELADAFPDVERGRGGVHLKQFAWDSLHVELTVFFVLSRPRYRDAVQQLLLAVHRVVTEQGAALVTARPCECCAGG